MFNWLKKAAQAAIKAPNTAPKLDISQTPTDNLVTQFSMNESEALKNQGNIYLANGKLAEAADCFTIGSKMHDAVK